MNAIRFAHEAERRFVPEYVRTVDRMIRAQFGGYVEKREASQAHGEAIAKTMATGEVAAAAQALRKAATAIPATMAMRHDASSILAFAASDAVPNVTFDEAVEELIAKTPVVLRPAAERTAAQIARLYSEQNAIAFAKSAEQSVTEHVQDLMARAMREGVGEAEAGRVIAEGANWASRESEEWTEAYARMAFRTNLNTAITAGRFRQASDPDVRDLVPAMMFSAVGDSDTRPNHMAADGMILKQQNPAWHKLASPLGYSCRCSVILVTRPELESLGRIGPRGEVIESPIPVGAFPDPGFRHGGRPDLFRP